MARDHEVQGTGDYAHAVATLQQRGWRSVKQTATRDTRSAKLVKGGWTIEVDYHPAAGLLPTPTLDATASAGFC